jgi:hypothetical protein
VYRPVSEVRAEHSSDLQLWVSNSGSGMTVNYTLPKSEKISVELYDAVGRKIADIATGEMTAGYHSNPVRTSTGGSYFVKMSTERGSKTVGAYCTYP